MDWRPPVDGDVWLQFTDGERVKVRRDLLQPHEYFAALLGPHFSEGLVASQCRTLKLNEDWVWFRHVLHVMYDDHFRLDNFSPEDIRHVIEIADRLGVVPAVEVCLGYVRDRMSVTLFFELSPLLSGCIAFASAKELRRALFGNGHQNIIHAITKDERWNDLSLGVREEVLDVLEYYLAQHVGAKSTSRNRLTVANAMKRCGAVPGDFADTQNKYERLDQKSEYKRSGQCSDLPAQQDVSALDSPIAMQASVELAQEASSGHSMRESMNMKSGVVHAVATRAQEDPGLQWFAWTTTDEGLC